MATKRIEVRCERCRETFNSPIMLGDEDTFDTATVSGNKMQCPKCGKWTGVDKENMRVVFDDGGFTGNKAGG